MTCARYGRELVIERSKTDIVRIIARLNVGGPARHVVWLTDALQDEEFGTVLIAGRIPEGEEDMGYFADEYGVEPTFIAELSRELSIGDLVALFKIWRKMVATEPAVIHTHTAKAGTLGRVAAFLYKWFTPGIVLGQPRSVHVFHTFHGHIFSGYYGDTKTRVFLLIEKILARFATDHIIVISEQQFKEINGVYGVGRSEQFRIIPLGLDLTNLIQNQDLRAEFRSEFGVRDDELLVGIVGRLTEIKNHRLFIKAVKGLQLSAELSGVRFVVVGDGHMKDELKSLAGDCGILFAGNRNDTAAFYSAIDVMALTSLNEGTPLTLIEAMAFGKPWIASEVGGVVDLAGEESGDDFDLGESVKVCERGVLFESEDVEGLIEGLSMLLKKSELSKAMGARGKSFVTANYSKERLVADIKKLYRTTQ